MDSSNQPEWAKGLPTGNEFPFPSLDFPDNTSPSALEIAARLNITSADLRALEDAGQLELDGDESMPMEKRRIAVECYRQFIHRRTTCGFDGRNATLAGYQALGLFNRLSEALRVEVFRRGQSQREGFAFSHLNFSGPTAVTLSSVVQKLDCFDTNYLVELIEDAFLTAIELSPRRRDVPVYRIPVEAHRCFLVWCFINPFDREFLRRLKPETAMICHRELGQYLGAAWKPHAV
jgi:hypothetical protein